MKRERTHRYLVVVVEGNRKSAIPATVGQSSNWQMTAPPVVKMIEAPTPEAAADQAHIPPGATAHVCLLAHVMRFTRPAEAPLVAS